MSAERRVDEALELAAHSGLLVMMRIVPASLEAP
jgi:hypothetical protein